MGHYIPVTEEQVVLADGRIADRSLLESEVHHICHYVLHVVMARNAADQICALIFPDVAQFTSPAYDKSPEEGCFCPRGLNELGKCLTGCIETANKQLQPGFAGISAGLIIKDTLNKENGTLDQDGKPDPVKILDIYHDYLGLLEGADSAGGAEVFVMKF